MDGGQHKPGYEGCEGFSLADWLRMQGNCRTCGKYPEDCRMMRNLVAFLQPKKPLPTEHDDCWVRRKV